MGVGALLAWDFVSGDNPAGESPVRRAVLAPARSTAGTSLSEHSHDRGGFESDLYSELHAIAARWMRDQPRNHTLQATELVHEAYLRLHGRPELSALDRVGFLAHASTAMRCALVDHARSRARQKRQPHGDRVPLDSLLLSYEDRAVDLLALDEALRRLDTFDPDMASAVDLRFFGGLSAEETAELLGIPLRTFERRWRAVRAWLRAEVE